MNSVPISINIQLDALVTYVNKWKAAGVLIDGIGSEAHLYSGGAGGVAAALAALAKTGLELAITELDIDQAPADEFVAVVEACLAVEACVGITMWGISDAVSSSLL